jgi:hypothetical protein
LLHTIARKVTDRVYVIVCELVEAVPFTVCRAALVHHVFGVVERGTREQV